MGGVKQNKLEYAHSVWTSWKQIDTPKLTLLTKRDLFRQKIKVKPLNVCPLFAEKEEQMDQLGLCIGLIRGIFESGVNRVYVVNTNQVKDIQHYFKILCGSL